MRRGFVAYLGLALVGLGLTGCGMSMFQEREPWRREAEEACLARKEVVPTAYMSLAPEMNGPGICGITHPFKVTAFLGGSVGLKTNVKLGCPIIPRIDGWLGDVVQPAAQLYFGQPVLEVKAGTYSCRTRNHRAGAKLSEHSFGNAIDVMSFRFQDGTEVSVLRGWRGTEQEQGFLREVFVHACRYFTTVLGPGSDSHHADHLHLDLARHDVRGQRHYCRPVIKFTPRLDPEAIARDRGTRKLPAVRPDADPSPLDIEEDTGSFPVSRNRETPASTSIATRAAPVLAAPVQPPVAAVRPVQAAPVATAPIQAAPIQANPIQATPVQAYRPPELERRIPDGEDWMAEPLTTSSVRRR